MMHARLRPKRPFWYFAYTLPSGVRSGICFSAKGLLGRKRAHGLSLQALLGRHGDHDIHPQPTPGAWSLVSVVTMNGTDSMDISD